MCVCVRERDNSERGKEIESVCEREREGETERERGRELIPGWST